LSSLPLSLHRRGHSAAIALQDTSPFSSASSILFAVTSNTTLTTHLFTNFRSTSARTHARGGGGAVTGGGGVTCPPVPDILNSLIDDRAAAAEAESAVDWPRRAAQRPFDRRYCLIVCY